MKPTIEPATADASGAHSAPAGPVPLAGKELRDRAAGGAILVAGRSVGILAIGMLGYLVFARLLSPAEFGVVALGLSITFFGHFLADVGIGPALLRRSSPPTQPELAAVTGLQLVVMGVLVLIALACALWTGGRTAAVTALFMASLPCLAIRLPATITLERDLFYRPLVVVEIVEAIVFNVVAVVAVLLGAGAYGLAGAAIVKTLAGSAVLDRLRPGMLLVPTFRLAPIRGLLRFGVAFQASSAVSLARDFLWYAGIAAVGGYAMVGWASLVGRVVSIPLTVLQAASRVSFPAMSRLLAAGEDPRPPIERGIAAGAVLTVCLLTPLAAGGADALTGVLGDPWREAGTILPPICLGLAIAMPTSVVVTGYLYALGDARFVLTSNVALTAVSLTAGAVLLPLVGYSGLGIASMLGMLTNAVMLAATVRRRAAVHVIPQIVRPVTVAILGFAVGAFAASPLNSPLGAAAVGSGLSLIACLLGLALFDRTNVVATARLVRRSFRSARTANKRAPSVA